MRVVGKDNICMIIIFLGGSVRSFFDLGLSMRFSELEFSVKYFRSNAVFGLRLKRPTPCRIRSTRDRDQARGLSETSEKQKRKVLNFHLHTPELFLNLGIYVQG